MSYLILTLSILNFLLGVLVLVEAKKTKTNIAFLVFAGVTSLWTLNNYYLRLEPSLMYLQFSYAMGVLVATTALVWLYLYLKERIPLWVYIFVVPATAALFLLTIRTNLIVQELISVETFGYEGELGSLFTVYTLYLAFLIATMLFELIRARLHAKEQIQKTQIGYILTGVSIFAVTSTVVSFIIPEFWDTLRFTAFDNLSFSFFLIFIVFAIFEHKLFDFKIVTTEFFTVALWIFLFVQMMRSEDTRDWMINGLLFLLSVIIGALLIRSVLKEVHAKERIKKLAHDLARANEKLKVLDRRKSEFISIATHQIRSPLAAIKGYASLMLEGSFGAIPPKLVEPIERVLHSSTALAYVVNDFLDISRIELNRMKYEYAETDLIEIVENVIADLKSSIDKRGLALVFIKPKDGPYNAVIDAGKVRQVISNLVDNATKYTMQGSITIKIRPAGEKYHICIADTGIGMSQETISVLFEKFTRAKEASKTNIMGTGLGLYVAKQLIEHHGGRVWAESEGEGKGSEFHIEIPKVAPESKEAV